MPVLLLEEVQDRLGGAANVAQNITALGGQVALGGIIGQDEAGARLCELLTARGIGVSGMLRREIVTTVKTRALAGAHQLLRIDSERKLNPTPEDIQAVLSGLQRDLPQPQVVLVSDYAKGMVTRGLIAAIRDRVGDVPIFVDPKGRDYTRYRGAALITPNEREATLAAGVEIHDDDSLRRAAQELQRQLPGATIIITRGAKGLSLFTPDGAELHAPAQARRVFDVTGAGDTAIAALALFRASQLPWNETLRVANVAAGLAVGKIGASPVYLSEVLGALSHDEGGIKLVTRQALTELRRTTAKLGQKLVFTNGCFDLLHVGHLRLLRAARAMGDVLLVAVNSDDSVRRLKGPTRPVVSQEDRAALLAGLEAVDFVTLFDEDTPLEAILACQPDVLVKGGDYSPATIVGAPEVERWGGRVAVIPLVEGRSTTSMVQRAGRT